jgi:hypothetical protein
MEERDNPGPPESKRPTNEAELTLIDIGLARQQCEIQHATSPEQIQGMIDALAKAKAVAFSAADLDAEQVYDLVMSLGSIIEPVKAGHWRIVPVTFSNGETGIDPDNIPEAMFAWADAFAAQRLDPTELYYQFELVHPKVDGNGRIGHCLWAIAMKRQIGDWPEELPPDVFAEGYRPERKSAFGDIE